jgi:uncharacterized protein YaaR (DUF327 family)
MALDKQDLQDFKKIVVEGVQEVVEPYFHAIQKDFTSVYERLDRVDRRLDHIEQFLLEEHRRRITKPEDQVQDLRSALAIK